MTRTLATLIATLTAFNLASHAAIITLWVWRSRPRSARR